MCVLYVSVGSKLRPRTFGCVAMCSAVLFICLVYLLNLSNDENIISGSFALHSPCIQASG